MKQDRPSKQDRRAEKNRSAQRRYLDRLHDQRTREAQAATPEDIQRLKEQWGAR